MVREMGYFVVGVLVGAALALLFAPQSGREYRAGILSAAAREQDRLRTEWQARMARPGEGLDEAGQETRSEAEIEIAA